MVSDGINVSAQELDDFSGVIKINEAQVKGHLGSLVRKTVEEMLNDMPDKEAQELCNAARYERTESRKDSRAGFYKRKLHSVAGEVELKVPKLRHATFETAIIERYRRREAFVEGAKEDKESWASFLRHLKERGLKGVQLVISYKCLGLVEAAEEFYPEAHYQRCVCHWYRNVFSDVPGTKMKEVAAMLKAIHAQEDRDAAVSKADMVADKLDEMRLKKAAQTVRTGAHETFSYYKFPSEHWRQLRTNNMLERIMREIRRRTRVVGCFPDGNSALMLAAARLRHISGTKWGSRQYMNMKRLEEMTKEEALSDKIFACPSGHAGA